MYLSLFLWLWRFVLVSLLSLWSVGFALVSSLGRVLCLRPTFLSLHPSLPLYFFSLPPSFPPSSPRSSLTLAQCAARFRCCVAGACTWNEGTCRRKAPKKRRRRRWRRWLFALLLVRPKGLTLPFVVAITVHHGNSFFFRLVSRSEICLCSA